MYFVKIYFVMILNICPWPVAAGFWTEGKICGISEKTRFTKKINKITENNASSFAKKTVAMIQRIQGREQNQENSECSSNWIKLQSIYNTKTAEAVEKLNNFKHIVPLT